MGERRPTRRRRGLVVAVFLVSCIGIAGSAAGGTRTPAMLTISGHGFGQGLGLSQWGAEERARAGQSTRRILRFYYPGTTLERTGVRTVRVLISRRRRVVVGSRGGILVRPGSARATTSVTRSIAFDAGARDGRAYPVVLSPRTSPLTINGRPYAGTVTIEPSDGRLLVVNDVDLRDYVAGVVSVECPSSWRPAALRAQAIASRTYAVANLHPDRVFDLFPDDRSQNYRGLAAVNPAATAAARATGSSVLTFGGRVVEAFFSAADGGQTNDSVAAWSVAGVPYLVSRTDPFDARSPDTDWGPVRISLAELHHRLPQVPSSATSVLVKRNDAGRARTLVFTSPGGRRVVVDGYRFQQRLGLRSTFFSRVTLQV